MTTDNGSTTPASYRNVVLAMLLIVYTLNYLDRQIVGILAQAIKADLKLTDSQLGLMGGLAFAILYTSLAIPIARLADRFNRVRIITIALVTWSAFTGLCGMAAGFTSLFLARLGVGIGEAGGIAPTLSILSDYFPPERRARALALLALGLPLGSAFGLLIGGWLAAMYSWRTAFLTMSAVGLAIAPIFLFAVREPARGRLDSTPVSDGPAPSLLTVLRTMAPKRTFWLISLASAMASMITYGLSFWLPAFMQRSHHLDIASTANFLAGIALTGGVAGSLAGGYLSDHLGRTDRRAYGRVPAIAFAIALPALFLAINLSSLPLVFAALLVPQMMGHMWMAPSLAVVQNVTPASMRATASAIYLFIVNMFGLGIGTVAFGVLSDLLTARFGDGALRYAILICGAVLYPLATLLYFAAGRSINRDMP